MNGVHDMGGLQGFGPVQPEADEPLFHAAWERRALGLTLAMGATGAWNIDQSRAARESLPPAQYLGSSYYAIWLAALERLMLQRGLLDNAEVAAVRRGRLATAAAPNHAGGATLRVLHAADVDAALARGTPVSRPAAMPAPFARGDRVRARNLHPPGHTRLPRYVRGHVGTVVDVHGAHLFADAHAECRDEAQWLFTVEFAATELWGPHGDPRDSISVDAWASYLEAA
ncbi:MAG: nitrile hydratase subunit beta [Burkholderiaceae bacterium]|nr:nitrile hydratase subunit beta [Rhodoferax sp.]MCP5283364.1 nitrile hydratase subunit beta [Burkholderiaceae bacterium]